MNLREQQLRDVKVTGIGTGEASCGRSPNLFEHVQTLMNSEYDKQVEFLRKYIADKVVERATERKLWADLKRLVGTQFRVELQPEVTQRVIQWLKSEGFDNVSTVGEKVAENASKPVNQRLFNVHNNPYRGYSDSTLLLEW